MKSTLDIKGRGGDIELDNVEGQVNINGAFGGITQIRKVAKTVHFVSPFTDFTTEKVPGTLRISLGDVVANGITGPIRLSTSRSKDVELSDFTNSLEINLSGGDIRLNPGAGPTPKMDVRTRRGDVELSLSAPARFDLTATTDRGDAQNDFGAPVAHSSSGRGSTLKGSNGGPAISIETKQGDVRVRKASVVDGKKLPPAPEAPQVPLRPLNQ